MSNSDRWRARAITAETTLAALERDLLRAADRWDGLGGGTDGVDCANEARALVTRAPQEPEWGVRFPDGWVSCTETEENLVTEADARAVVAHESRGDITLVRRAHGPAPWETVND